MDRMTNPSAEDEHLATTITDQPPRPPLSDEEVRNRVVVVGSGLGGLAAACTLAARGYAVVLCEKNEWVGGKAAVLEAEGYRFDMGPTILTIPAVLSRIFAEAGRPLESALDLVPLDPQWRSFFVDGTTLDLKSDVDAMRATLDAFAPGSGAGDGYESPPHCSTVPSCRGAERQADWFWRWARHEAPTSGTGSLCARAVPVLTTGP